MDNAPTVAILVLALLTAPALAGGALADSNDEQTGRADSTCMPPSFPGTGEPPGYHAARNDPLTNWVTQHNEPSTVDVEPGTAFRVDLNGTIAESDGIATNGEVRFYDVGGKLLDSVKDGYQSNTVPRDAAYAVVCDSRHEHQVEGQPAWASATHHNLAEFTYQDGWTPGSEDAPNRA